VAPSWGWIIAANALLGINQGLAWSMTVIMKVDLVGPKSRGLAVGLNEFAGYLAVGVTAFLTGYLASRYGLRPVPIYLGIGYAARNDIVIWSIRSSAVTSCGRAANKDRGGEKVTLVRKKVQMSAIGCPAGGKTTLGSAR